MPSKSFWKSKTFWLNILGMATTFAPGLPVDPATMVYVLGGLNLANRLLTESAVHLVTPPDR
jgi:hypothetical protein